MYIAVVWLIILGFGLFLLGVACAPLFRGIVVAWMSDIKRIYEATIADLQNALTVAKFDLTKAKLDLAGAETRFNTDKANITALAQADIAKAKADAEALVAEAEAKVSELMATIKTLTSMGSRAPVDSSAPASSPAPVDSASLKAGVGSEAVIAALTATS